MNKIKLAIFIIGSVFTFSVSTQAADLRVPKAPCRADVVVTSDGVNAQTFDSSDDILQDLSAEDKAKGVASMNENQQLMKIIESEGMSELFHDAGMGDTEVSNMEQGQAEFAEKIIDHVDENKRQLTRVGTTNISSDAKVFDIETKMNSLNERAEGLAADGEINEADNVQLQHESLTILDGIFGDLPQN